MNPLPADPKKEEKPAVVAAPETMPEAAKQEAAPAPALPAFQQEMSKGEKWFDWLLYKGLNYWVNLGSSLVIADIFINGRGKNFMKRSSNFLTGGNKAYEPAARVALDQLTLNSGGWLLCVPIKLIEDNKRWWVHKLNDWLGVDQTAPDGHKETPDEIYIEKEQPKQSWLKMFARRTLGSASTMVFGVALDKTCQKKLPTKKMIDGEMKDHIGGKQLFTDFFVDMGNNALKSGYIPGGASLAKQGWIQRYLSLAALDVINTEITSTVMEKTNGAKKAKAPHEIGDASQPAKFEVGEDLKPGEHRETIIVPDQKNIISNIVSRKKDEGFAAATRQTEAAGSLQLGA